MIRIGEVKSLYDENDGGRIKVFISPDDATRTDELPWAFPLLPKLLHIKPKIGEAVMVITSNDNNVNSQRYYIGPLISQSQYLNEDSFFKGATSTLDGGTKLPSSAVTRNPNVNGCFPKDDDIGIYGRKNTDIILTDYDVRIRCGVHMVDENDSTNVSFNEKSPSYVLLRYNPKKGSGNATIVGEDINLISTESSDAFKLTDREKLISDEEMDRIIKEAHKLPYGDLLVEFLKIFRKAMVTHTHPYPMIPPVQDSNMLNLIRYNVDEILSKHVRIS